MIEHSVVAAGIAPTLKGLRFGALLLIALSTQGCGQKGPLYLPTPQAAGAAAAAASATPTAQRP